MSVGFHCHSIPPMHTCRSVQVDEKPAKIRKKPACAPKSQPKVKKTALKQTEKEPTSKRRKTTQDDSTSTPRSKASKRTAKSPQEDAPHVKKRKLQGQRRRAKQRQRQRRPPNLRMCLMARRSLGFANRLLLPNLYSLKVQNVNCEWFVTSSTGKCILHGLP